MWTKNARFRGRIKGMCTLADPGFGQGGAPEILSEILPTKRSEVGRAKRANIGRGPGPALGPWKLLHFSLSNMHSPTFPGTFSSNSYCSFVWLHHKISIQI